MVLFYRFFFLFRRLQIPTIWLRCSLPAKVGIPQQDDKLNYISIPAEKMLKDWFSLSKQIKRLKNTDFQ
jgi:hypothetical protein